MAVFPWSELGLDGPGDERTVRRAYAARLKIVRPDVDAAGFQRLVAARDLALRVVESATLQSLQRPIAPPVKSVPKPTPDMPAEPPKGSTQAPRVIIEPGRTTAEDETPKNMPAAETPAPVEIDIAGEMRRPSAARQEPPTPQNPRPVAVDLDAPKPPPTWTGLEASQTKPAPGYPVPEAASPDEVSRLLSAFVYAWTNNQVLPLVAPILKLLGEQSISARQKLEVEALRAAAALLDKGLFDRKRLWRARTRRGRCSSVWIMTTHGPAAIAACT